MIASVRGSSCQLLGLLMITAAAHQAWPDDVAIDDHPVGLPIPSVGLTAKIATVNVVAA